MPMKYENEVYNILNKKQRFIQMCLIRMNVKNLSDDSELFLLVA